MLHHGVDELIARATHSYFEYKTKELKMQMSLHTHRCHSEAVRG